MKKVRLEVQKALVNIHLGRPTAAVACMILNGVLEAQSGTDLVLMMRNLKEQIPGLDHFFVYGFGSNYMWVKQRILQKESGNWITVYF